MAGRRVLNLLVGASVGSLIMGCAATAPHRSAAGGQVDGGSLPPARPLGAEYSAAGQGESAGRESSSPDEPIRTLRLSQALNMALLHNPGLQAHADHARAAESRALQAGQLPNPELELAVEEFNRHGEGFGSSEMAVGLGQLFELGGKRGSRRRVAEAEGALAGWDYESMRLDVLTSTVQRFATVIAAQRRRDLAASTVHVAEETSRAVTERVKAGKEPPLQASRARAELELARIERRTVEKALEVSRRALASLWGSEVPRFESVEGDLDAVPDEVPSLEALRLRLSLNPELARWDAELRLRQAALSLERGGRIPDLTASVGFRRYEEDGSDAFAFAIGVPLPFFDRNQHNITAAGHDLAEAEKARKGSEIALANELADAHAELRSSHERVEALRSRVVPAVEEAFEAAQIGYQQGKFGFLDMLDAQRGLFEIRTAVVDALLDYHIAFAETQRLTATPIDLVVEQGKENQ